MMKTSVTFPGSSPNTSSSCIFYFLPLNHLLGGWCHVRQLSLLLLSKRKESTLTCAHLADARLYFCLFTPSVSLKISINWISFFFYYFALNPSSLVSKMHTYWVDSYTFKINRNFQVCHFMWEVSGLRSDGVSYLLVGAFWCEFSSSQKSLNELQQTVNVKLQLFYNCFFFLINDSSPPSH